LAVGGRSLLGRRRLGTGTGLSRHQAHPAITASTPAILRPWKKRTPPRQRAGVCPDALDASKAPYLYLTCGDQEGLLPANRHSQPSSRTAASLANSTPTPAATTGTNGTVASTTPSNPSSLTCNQNKVVISTETIASRSETIAQRRACPELADGDVLLGGATLQRCIDSADENATALATEVRIRIRARLQTCR